MIEMTDSFAKLSKFLASSEIPQVVQKLLDIAIYTISWIRESGDKWWRRKKVG